MTGPEGSELLGPVDLFPPQADREETHDGVRILSLVRYLSEAEKRLAAVRALCDELENACDYSGADQYRQGVLDAVDRFRELTDDTPETGGGGGKVKYWTVTGDRRQRRDMLRLSGWPTYDWRELPPPEPGEAVAADTLARLAL